MLYTKSVKYSAVIVAAAAMTATIAFAETGAGVTATNFVTAAFNERVQVNHDRVKFQTKDQTDVRVQRLNFTANSRSGWHHHPGLLIVAVQSGAVTLTDHNCVSKTYGPGLPNGAVFVEGGEGAVQASSEGVSVAYATIIVPRGAAPRDEDDPVSCGLAFRNL